MELGVGILLGIVAILATVFLKGKANEKDIDDIIDNIDSKSDTQQRVDKRRNEFADRIRRLLKSRGKKSSLGSDTDSK